MLQSLLTDLSLHKGTSSKTLGRIGLRSEIGEMDELKFGKRLLSYLLVALLAENDSWRNITRLNGHIQVY